MPKEKHVGTKKNSYSQSSKTPRYSLEKTVKRVKGQEKKRNFINPGGKWRHLV